jgi:HSP20 family protein
MEREGLGSTGKKKGGGRLMNRKLANWSPMRKLKNMREEIDQLFEEPFFHLPLLTSSMTAPRINLYENEEEVVVEAAVPGLDEKDIRVVATEDSLTLRCEKKASGEESHNGYHRREFALGDFSRTISLPAAVKSEAAKAELKKGVLRITLPKLETSWPKTTQIPVMGY